MSGIENTVEQVDREAGKAAWNCVADQFNQWDDLSVHEQNLWAGSFARHRMAERERVAQVLRDEIAKLDELYQRDRHVAIANQKVGVGRCLMKVEDPDRAAEISRAMKQILAMAPGEHLGGEG